MLKVPPAAHHSVAHSPHCHPESQPERTASVRFAAGTLVGRRGEGLAEAAQRAARAMQPQSGPSVWELMRVDVILLSPTMTIGDVERILAVADLHCAPVVDEYRRPIGFVTRGDLGRLGKVDRSIAISEVMNCFAIAISVDAPVSKAAALMAFEGVAQCVVVGDRGHVVGMLSTMDLARRYAHDHGYCRQVGCHHHSATEQ